MSRWKVRLVGHRFDLEELPVWLADGELTVIEENGEFFLTSPLLDQLVESEDVRRAAAEYIEVLNALGKLAWSEYRNVSLGSLYRIANDGTLEHHETLRDGATARDKAKATVTKADGSEPPDARRGLLTQWLTSSAASERIGRALGYLADDRLTWSDLYRATEVVQEDMASGLHERGWISRNELSRFMRTANSRSVLGRQARHGSEPTDPPRNPMSFEEARTTVLALLREWLEFRASNAA
jgi:hypothetical protein